MTIITVVLIVCFASLWLCVLYLVPQLVDSLFRYRLWKLRDDLQEYIFDERLPNSPVISELLETIEDTIKRSSSVVLSKLAVFSRFWKSSKETEVKPSDFSDLSEKQQELVNAVMYEFYLSVYFKMIAGSPGGAFFLPLWLIYYKNRRVDWTTAPQTDEFKQLRQLRYTLRHDKSEPKDLVASVG